MISLLLALACIPVDGPKLLARHIASAVAEFAQLSPDTDLGYAPIPGVIRVMHPDELRRIALKHGLTVVAPAGGLCFEWPMRPMAAASAVEAMQRVLPSNARVEVEEFSRALVPDGILEFPLTGLQGNLWRGLVRYNGSNRFDVWARVRVTAKQTRMIATEALRSGEIVTASQLRVEEFEDIPVAGLVTTLEEAVGMVLKRPLPVGAVLKTAFLDRPSAVSKGDLVRLHTRVGEAHIAMEASAQAPGKIGDIIPVKNPSSGRILRARIEAPGEVRLAQ